MAHELDPKTGDIVPVKDVQQTKWRGPKPDDPLVRFWAKVMPEPNSGCWLWTGTTTNGGYGHFTIPRPRRPIRAHRFSYETFRGPIPEGMDLDHLCRTPCCVNPAHLEPVTRQANTLRGQHPSIVAMRAGVCMKGHAITADNGYATKYGTLNCLQCKRERARRGYHSRKQRGEEAL